MGYRKYLSPLDWLYGAIVDVRNSLYDRGVLRSYYLGARTISIGNITVGGTGKTPLVAHVAEFLSEKGEKVCILTRGYGRRDAGRRVLVCDLEKILVDAVNGGDEPVELAHNLLGKAIIVADRDRVAAAHWARDRFGITAFILDDGFQHRRAKRDLDIVCIDATNPVGNGKMLPAGELREPLHNLSRAQVLVITRTDLVNGVETLRKAICRYNSKIPVFAARNGLIGVLRLDRFTPGMRAEAKGELDLQEVGDSLAFCAIGNPQSFFAQLERERVPLVSTRAFPDHHYYSQADIDSLEREAAETGAKTLLTTAKDATKLKDLRLLKPCFVILTSIEVNDQEAFRKFL